MPDISYGESEGRTRNTNSDDGGCSRPSYSVRVRCDVSIGCDSSTSSCVGVGVGGRSKDRDTGTTLAPFAGGTEIGCVQSIDASQDNVCIRISERQEIGIETDIG
jgi:hypothetical protein